jgi:c-di-GMP-binding flagellar brake protein YcgR
MKIGQGFELIVSGKFFYQATVVNLSDDGILLAVDIYKRHLNILAGETVRARVQENGSLDEFELEIRKKIKSTNLLLVGYPKKYEKVQRRQFYRIKVWEDYSVYYSEKDFQPTPPWVKLTEIKSVSPKPAKDYKKAQLLDISAQGLAFLADKSLKKGKKIGLILDFIKPPIKVVGQIVRVVGEEKPYKISVVMKLNQIDSDRLMKFVFEKQSAVLATKAISTTETITKMPSLKLSKSNDRLQEEARKTFRLSNIALPINYKVVKDYLDITLQNYNYAVLRNISFTGASFIADDMIDDDAEIWIKIKIGDQDIRLLGRSLRSRKLPQINKYEIGLKFQAIDMRSSKKLISFIYYEHRLQNLDNEF